MEPLKINTVLIIYGKDKTIKCEDRNQNHS